MPYLFGVVFAQHDCYYIEAKGPVLDIVGGKKILCRTEHSGFFGFCNRRLGRAEILICSCLYLDKDKRSIAIDHNQVDFTGLAGEIASERSQTLAFEEFLAALFTPSAEQIPVRQQPAFVRQQFS